MPELPEIEAYLAALEPRIVGQVMERVRVASPSLLRTFAPPVDEAAGRTVTGLDRIGKRIVLALSGDLFLVVHLMVAGRLHWVEAGKAIPRKYGQAAFDFPEGTLMLTEAGTKRRASLHVIAGRAELAKLDPGGIEVAGASAAEFKVALPQERHTLKRALTDARFISGIGGTFADEILHRARLSPLQMNTNLGDSEIDSLRQASQSGRTYPDQTRGSPGVPDGRQDLRRPVSEPAPQGGWAGDARRARGNQVATRSAAVSGEPIHGQAQPIVERGPRFPAENPAGAGGVENRSTDLTGPRFGEYRINVAAGEFGRLDCAG